MIMTDSVSRLFSALVVEDQAPMRAALCDLLRMLLPSVQVLEAADGANALEVFALERPLLVLMDVCLPDADGIELTHRIETLAPETLVVVVSIDSSARTRARAMAAGAVAFIPKDHIFEELEPLLADLNRLSKGAL